MGSAGEGQVIQILDVSHSGSNTLVTTSLAGGLPTMPGSVINARAHYAPQLFASGNTGSVDAIDLSQTPAGAPMWSYSKRVYTSNPGATAPVWGLFSQVNMTPTALYTGTALSFDLNTALVDRTSSSGPANFLPSIDVKSGLNATRTINPTSTSGSQGADSLSAPSAGVNSAFVSGQTVPCYWNGSACAIPGGGLGSTSVTLEIITNQQVVNPAQQ
jgi:hypothetical protein